MGKISNPDISEVLHIELRSAINDLAKSVQVAATRIKLRAECAAAIKDAAKTENIAKTLRAVATFSDKTTEHPESPLAPMVQSSVTADTNGLEAMETIYAACTWLSNSQTSQATSKTVRQESAIAKCIVDLQDRIRDQGKDTN